MASLLQEPVGMLLSRTTLYNIECMILNAIKLMSLNIYVIYISFFVLCFVLYTYRKYLRCSFHHHIK